MSSSRSPSFNRAFPGAPSGAGRAAALGLAMLATGCSSLLSSEPPGPGGAPSADAIGIYYPPGFARFPVVLEGREPDPRAAIALGGATRRYVTRALEAQALPALSLRSLPAPARRRGAPAIIVEPRIERLSIKEPAPWGGFSGSGIHRAEIRYRVVVHRGAERQVLELTGRAQQRFGRTLLAVARHHRERIARLAMRDALDQLVGQLRRRELAEDGPRVQPVTADRGVPAT